MTLACYANESSSKPRVQHTFAIAVANASDDPIIVFDVRKTSVLNCSIANNANKLKIQWFKNDQEIADADSVYYHIGEAQLHILNATILNEGVYKCVVEIKGAGASKIKLYQTSKTAFKPYWSKWSPWSRCQPKCGKNSTKRRVRVCHRSKLLQPYTKWRCPGENMQRKRCPAITCSQTMYSRDGVWTEWSDWSGCSRTCGYGQMFRYRECTTNADQLHPCDGPNVEVIECFRIHCVENARVIPRKNHFSPFQINSRSLV